MDNLIILTILGLVFLIVIKNILYLKNLVPKKTSSYNEKELPDLKTISRIIEAAAIMKDGKHVLFEYENVIKHNVDNTNPHTEYLKHSLWGIAFDMVSGAIITLNAQERHNALHVNNR